MWNEAGLFQPTSLPTYLASLSSVVSECCVFLRDQDLLQNFERGRDCKICSDFLLREECLLVHQDEDEDAHAAWNRWELESSITKGHPTRANS